MSFTFRNPSREYLTEYYFPENPEGSRFDEEAYRRYKSELALEDEKRDRAIKEDNKNHGAEQMKFSYSLMMKMEKMLGGPLRVMSWFISVYKENVNLPAVTEELALGHWQKEVGIFTPVNIPEDAKKKFFDPPKENVLADEDGVVIEPTQESVGF